MKYSEDSIKAYIKRYFSDDLQHDETIAGAMERKQLQKWLTNWAKDSSYPKQRASKQLWKDLLPSE